MHDVLEGSLQLHIKCLLKYCILQMKYFTLDILNTRIHSFYFGTADATNRLQLQMQGNISYIALLPGQYLDIAREGGFQLSFDPPFDPTFHL